MLSMLLLVLPIACKEDDSGSGADLFDGKDSLGAESSADETADDSALPEETADTAPPDDDADGFDVTSDCDDTDASIHPGAFDACADGMDSDCDGADSRCVATTDLSNADAVIRGDYPGLTTGYDVANVGDNNGDGVDDLVVGAPLGAGTASGTHDGGAHLFLGGSRLTGEVEIAAAVGWMVSWPAANGYASSVGKYLGRCGDVDGDGTDEVCASKVAAENIDEDGKTGSIAGTGLHDRLSGTVAIGEMETILWDDLGNTYNEAIAGGDLDGDGFSDMVIGAPYWGIGAGAVYVVPGPVSGNVYLSALAYVMEGEAQDDNAGFDLDVLGDLDGDGLDDLAVSAQGHEVSGWDEGAVYVVTGPVDTGMNLSDADATFYGPHSWAYGGRPSRVGDLDGDGRDELAVGTTSFGPSGGADRQHTGALFIVHDPVAAEGPPRSLDVADATLVGEAEGDRAGFDFGSADFDGDGQLDLAVGAVPVDGDGGRAYVVLGAISGTRSLADSDWKIVGSGPPDELGHALATGDFDGDGLGDLAVGAPYEGTLANSAGAVFIFYGPIP